MAPDPDRAVSGSGRQGQHRHCLQPAARANAGDDLPDFLFVQMQNPDFAPRDWEPAFVDYFYLSFTNATAFSPTDVMPLSRWAKLTMMVQAGVALVVVVLVVARAINALS